MGTMHCAHCGRPAFSLVWIGDRGYHVECLHGPGWVQDTYQSPPQPMWFGLTEERVRQIVCEELEKKIKNERI